MSYSGLISIIIPIYNGEKYIDECLCSILKQTYTNIEIVIVNDGSSDGSINKLMNYLNNDKRIKLINLEYNAGVSNARYVGVKAAIGEWICFIDIDDYIKPYYIESFVKRITAGINIYCIENIDENIGVKEWVSGLIENRFFWFVHHKMYNRKILLDKDVLGIPKCINIGEDLILNLRLSDICGSVICFFRCDGYIYKENLESVSRSRKYSLSYAELFINEVEKTLGNNLSFYKNEIWLFKFRAWKNLISKGVYVSPQRFWVKSLWSNIPNIKFGLGDKYVLLVKNYYFAYIGLKLLFLFKLLTKK